MVVLVFVIGRFWNIQLGDLRHWDESLYAWRAKVAAATGEWGDQSDYSFNFFYSGAFPPLLIWQMGAGITLFGDAEWAVRAPVAMHGVLALLAAGGLGWLLAGRGTGWLSLVLLGSISYFTRFSRAAQFDVPAVAWMVVMLACYVASLRFPARRRFWVCAAGVAMGAGLMTKIAVTAFAYPALIATMVAWWLLGRWGAAAGWPESAAGKDNDDARGDSLPIATIVAEVSRRRISGLVADQLVLGGVAAALWLPWHVWMGWRHGQLFWDWYIGYHLLDRSVQVLDHQDGAWWFYLYSAYDRLPTVLVGLGGAAWFWLFALAIGAARGAKGAPNALAGLAAPAPDHVVDEINSSAAETGAATRGANVALTSAAALLLPWLWTTSLWILLESSATKREIYLLTLYPAIAVMGALLATRLFRRPAAGATWWVVLFVASFCEIISRDAGREYALGLYLSGGATPPHGNSVASEILLVTRPHLLGAAAIAILPAVVGAVAGIRAPRSRARWWRDAAGRLVLTVLISIAAWQQGLRGMAEPDQYDEAQEWHDVRPWLQDEARFPKLAYVGDGEGPQFMYYLNGNHPESQPIPWRPIGRFYNLDSGDLRDRRASLRDYAVEGGALIVSEYFWSEAHRHPRWAEVMAGFEETFRNEEFIVFEYRGGGGARD
jgi:4-amino-4-deoxy-L-arabinose transferase-like glycosyltransferase